MLVSYPDANLVHALLLSVISIEESKRYNAFDSTFQDPKAIAKVIVNATKAVITIARGENGPVEEISTTNSLLFILGAQLVGFSHVTIFYDTAPPIFTSTIVLDRISSFFNNLFAKPHPLLFKEFLDGLIEMNLKCTFTKAKLTDDFASESSYNFVPTTEGITG